MVGVGVACLGNFWERCVGPMTVGIIQSHDKLACCK